MLTRTWPTFALAFLLAGDFALHLAAAHPAAAPIRIVTSPVAVQPEHLGSTARLDLNRADLAALTALPGVGPATAERIIAWRSAHGGFVALDQLRQVRGIGPATFKRLAPWLTL